MFHILKTANLLCGCTAQANMHQKHNVSMVQALRDEVVARIEERKREYEGILNAKASQSLISWLLNHGYLRRLIRAREQRCS